MNAKLSTHVLDTYHGKPAHGIAWSLSRQSSDQHWQNLGSGLTNADGRTDQPLLLGEDLQSGAYRLSFDVGQYFIQEKVELPQPTFLQTVHLDVHLIAGQSYHVPLLVSPWSYSTYRGS